jgi:hypothetical protein
MSPRPTVAEYDAFARQGLAEVVLPRRHRTTKRVIAEAPNEEQRCLRRYRITAQPPMLAPRPSRLDLDAEEFFEDLRC